MRKIAIVCFLLFISLSAFANDLIGIWKIDVAMDNETGFFIFHDDGTYLYTQSAYDEYPSEAEYSLSGDMLTLDFQSFSISLEGDTLQFYMDEQLRQEFYDEYDLDDILENQYNREPLNSVAVNLQAELKKAIMDVLAATPFAVGTRISAEEFQKPVQTERKKYKYR